MYHLHVLGAPVASLATALGSLRNVPELCTLVHEVAEFDQDDEAPSYTGPLLEAPDGRYHLWVTKVGEPLVIATGKVMVGPRLLARLTTRTGGKVFVAPKVLETFQALLAGSERRLHVYQEPRTGDQRFRLLWPNDHPGAFHDKEGHYPYLGVVNLRTGEVVCDDH